MRDMQRMNHTVLELTFKFKYEWENLDRRDLARLLRSVKRWHKTAKYGGKIVSVLVVTDETSRHLMDRVRDDFAAVSALENYWCQTAGSDGLGMNGDMCPFQSRTAEAWEEARKRNYPKKMKHPRTANIWLNHGIDYVNRQKAVKMGIKPRKKRDAPEKPTKD